MEKKILDILLSIPMGIIAPATIFIILLILFFAWIVFRYFGTTTKIISGFVFFSLAFLIFVSSTGIKTIKDFRNEWLKWETTRLKEGAFVFIERLKRNSEIALKRFVDNPEDLKRDEFIGTTFDGIIIIENGSVWSSLGDIKIYEVRRFQWIEIDGKNYFAVFERTKNGFIGVLSDSDIRILPPLRDMLKTEEIYLSTSPSDYAIPIEGKYLTLKPSEEDIISILKRIGTNFSRTLGAVLIFFVVFFGILSAYYIRRPLLELMKGSENVSKGNLDFSLREDVKGDLGRLIRTFNLMIFGLKKRDAEIRYRNELLSAIREFGEKIIGELDKTKVMKITIDVVSKNLNAKCAILNQKIVGEIDEDVRDRIEEIEGKVNGQYFIVSDISVEFPQKINYGKLVVSRDKAFSPHEKEFINSITSYLSSHFQRSDFVLKLQLMQASDPITGLSNERHFRISVEQENSRMKRFGIHFSIIFLNLNFSEIAEKFGYIFANEILRTIGGVIRKNLRIYDISAHFGDGKFAILLPNTIKDNAKTVEKRILDTITTIPEIPSEVKIIPEIKIYSSNDEKDLDFISDWIQKKI